MQAPRHQHPLRLYNALLSQETVDKLHVYQEHLHIQHDTDLNTLILQHELDDWECVSCDLDDTYSYNKQLYAVLLSARARNLLNMLAPVRHNYKRRYEGCNGLSSAIELLVTNQLRLKNKEQSRVYN